MTNYVSVLSPQRDTPFGMDISWIDWSTADYEWTMRKTYRVTVRLTRRPIPRETLYLPEFLEDEFRKRGFKDATATVEGDVLVIETVGDIFGTAARVWQDAIQQAVDDASDSVTRLEARENAEGAAWHAALRVPPSDS